MNSKPSPRLEDASGSPATAVIFIGAVKVTPPSVDWTQYVSKKTTPGPTGVPSGTSSTTVKATLTFPFGSTDTAWNAPLRPATSPATTGVDHDSPPSVDLVKDTGACPLEWLL